MTEMALRLPIWKIFLAVSAALWICVVARPIRAQEAEAAFYKGKTVRLIVGYAGGGYDIYARLIAPYIAKALGTTVVVVNQPGAGGITALDNLVVAPPDGLQMMIVNGAGAALGQLIGQPGVRYDLAKVGYLGTVNALLRMWLVTPRSPIKTPQDAINAHTRMMWAAGGPIDGSSDGAAFICAALALDCHVVMGYPGSAESALALGRGEMDAFYVADTSANNFVKAGEMRAVAAIGHERSRFFPDTPTIFEAVNLTSDQEWLFDFRATVDKLGRILIVPPNLPAARLAYLQAAVKKALTDATLVAEGERTQNYVDYIDAEQTRESARKVVESIASEQRQRVKAILSESE
jgi:tripartite-type tricarboxylate transporter receptor subunit TctC